MFNPISLGLICGKYSFAFRPCPDAGLKTNGPQISRITQIKKQREKILLILLTRPPYKTLAGGSVDK